MMLKLKELEDLMREITISALNIPKAKAKKMIRISWPTYNDSGSAPEWKQDEDVIFLRVKSKDNQINRLRDVSYSSIDDKTAKSNIKMTRAIEFFWVLYGENSFDLAETLRIELLTEKIKTMAALKNLYIVPDFSAPIRTPEEFNGMWWERSDFFVEAYEAINYETKIDLFDDASVKSGIHLITEKGEIPIHDESINR